MSELATLGHYVPVGYRGRRTLTRAYRRGYTHGTIARVGGTPLPPYRYPGPKDAYVHGFLDAQCAKRVRQRRSSNEIVS
jgi:hypothetical protein